MKQWREAEGKSMAEAAALLSIRHAATYNRYETGENRPDAPLAARIVSATGGKVTLDDLHLQRLEWLRQNRPDILVDYPEVYTEAAE